MCLERSVRAAGRTGSGIGGLSMQMLQSSFYWEGQRILGWISSIPLRDGCVPSLPCRTWEYIFLKGRDNKKDTCKEDCERRIYTAWNTMKTEGKREQSSRKEKREGPLDGEWRRVSWQGSWRPDVCLCSGRCRRDSWEF